MIQAAKTFEKSIIGAVLIDPSTFDLIALSPRDFADARAGVAWQAFSDLRCEGRPVDSVTAEAQANARGAKLEPSYLAECALACATPQNAAEYAALVRQDSIRRDVMIAAGDIAARGAAGELNGSELLSEALRVFSALDSSGPTESLTIQAVLRERFAQLQARSAAGELTGHPTGVAKLDDVIGGWQPGIVSIVAARPGHGKSSLALATTNACTRAGVGVHIFSLEDPRASYADRVLASASKIPADSIRRSRLNPSEFDGLRAATEDLNKRKGWLVDDRSGIAADEIVRSVRRARRANGTRVVIVDYLQLIARNRDAHSVHESVGANLNILADAAKNDGMAYVVMSQLNRGVEQREDKRPQIADMRESGTIEERAKCVVGLYRGAAYGDPVEGVDVDERGRMFSPHEHARAIQLLILKNSNGPSPARVIANWDGPTTRIW